MTETTAVPNAFTNEPKVLDEYVGEGKKFRDAEALARGKKEADDFIARLQAENAEIRAELKKRPTEAEVTEKVKQTLTQNTTSAGTPANQPGVTKEELMPLVREVLTSTQQAETAQSNIANVTSKLDGLHGDRQKAQKFLADKATELGVTLQFLEQTAAKSPMAFFNLVGIKEPNPNAQTTNTTTKTKGTVSTERLGSEPQQDTWEYFQKLRRENKAKYFSPSVQNHIHKLKQEGKLVLPN